MSCLVVSYLKKKILETWTFSRHMIRITSLLPTEIGGTCCHFGATRSKVGEALVPPRYGSRAPGCITTSSFFIKHLSSASYYTLPHVRLSVSLSLRVLCVLSSLKTNNRTQSQVSIWGFCDNHNCTLFIRGIISRVHNAQARNARQLTTEWQYRFELS